MRVGKTAVAVGVVLAVASLLWAQDNVDLESLLSDIGAPPPTSGTATAVSPDAPASTEVPVAEAAPVETPVATEPAAPAEAPASDLLGEMAPAAEAPAMEVVAETTAVAVEEAPAADVTDLLSETPAAEAAPEAAALETPAPSVDDLLSDTAAAAPAPAADDFGLDSLLQETAPAAAAPATETVVVQETIVEETPAGIAEEVETVAVKTSRRGLEEKPEKSRKELLKEAKEEAKQQEVRRQAEEIQALKDMESGFKALTEGNYSVAITNFDSALIKLPERPATMDQRQQAQWGLSEAQYMKAKAILEQEDPDLAQARQLTERALRYDPESKGAQVQLKRIEKLEAKAAIPKPPKLQPQVISQDKEINDLFNEGRRWYEIKNYDRAEALFEKILLKDQYNKDAMRFLKKIEDDKFKISTLERDATVAGMMRDVRQTWNPPIKDEVNLPEDLSGQGVIETKTSAQRLQEKMKDIIIPSIEFRQANIADVVDFLVNASISADKDKQGVNIILNLNIPGQESAAPAVAPAAMPAASDDPFAAFDAPAADFGGPAAMSGDTGVGVRTITLNLRRISLLDAIRFITEVAGLKYRLEDNAVIITPENVPSGRIVTRMYPVMPSIMDVIVEKEETETERTGEFVAMGGGRATVKKSDVKDFFQKAGVPFPAGTSITYNQGISQLIVANTPDNLEIFERILTQLNVIPNQVEIEARFIEVGQNDLEELGMEWILTDNYEFAVKDGAGPVAGRERMQVNADQDGFTKGLRFFNFDSSTASVSPASPVTKQINMAAMGGIMSISSVLTNPEMTVIIHALSQHGGSDLLSAPRVTTRSGVNAQIQVVREIIYPTEFEVTQPTVQSQGDLVTPPVVTPGSFQTREVGVILNVTPTVGPDGYTIDLTMVPEVAELVDWIQYGNTITLEIPKFDVLGIQVGTQERTYTFNMPQPVFSSRNVTTSIVIWDGQTVVMGGLIREELVKIKDKVPILGDIPLVGRLFRNEGQSSKKVNLLIFVTARLVDPAGRPIHKAEAMSLPGSGMTTTPAAMAATP